MKGGERRGVAHAVFPSVSSLFVVPLPFFFLCFALFLCFFCSCTVPRHEHTRLLQVSTLSILFLLPSCPLLRDASSSLCRRFGLPRRSESVLLWKKPFFTLSFYFIYWFDEDSSG